MPEKKDERRNFYERELWPQLNAEQFLLDRAEEAHKRGEIEDAFVYLKSALLVNPNNKQVEEKIKDIKKQRLKHLVHNFIKHFYPSELHLFDLTWQIYENIPPKNFTPHLIPEALSIISEETIELQTPRVIVILNELTTKNIDKLSDQEARKLISQIGQATGCPQKLINQITGFILSE